MYNPQATRPSGDPSGNTSGMGRLSSVPAEVRGWNWGAFFLTVIWGVGNNVWSSLLVFVPLVGFVMPFVLGAAGNTWAWRNRRWRDVAHFRRVQRRWALAGLVLWLLMLAAGIGVPVTVYRVVMHNPVLDLALTAVRTSPEAVAVLGSPVEKAEPLHPHFHGFSIEEGTWEVSFDVVGPRGQATVQATATYRNGGWNLERVTVSPAGSRIPFTVLPRQRL